MFKCSLIFKEMYVHNNDAKIYSCYKHSFNVGLIPKNFVVDFYPDWLTKLCYANKLRLLNELTLNLRLVYMYNSSSIFWTNIFVGIKGLTYSPENTVFTNYGNLIYEGGF